jgi:hypothetical protein
VKTLRQSDPAQLQLIGTVQASDLKKAIDDVVAGRGRV